MRKRFKPPVSHSSEFELDLAPLLAVMVKLVPVLLLSSAFVQVMMIETELPQVVKEAIQNEEQDPSKKATVSLTATAQNGFQITVTESGNSQNQQVPLTSEGKFNFSELHKALQGVKADHPDTFRLELNPDPSLPYSAVVQIMDEARKSRDKDVRFTFFDKKSNKEVTTDFMFPDIVFANMME